MRRKALTWLVVVTTVCALGACDEPSMTAGCRPPRSQLGRLDQSAAVTHTDTATKLRVGSMERDETITVVGYCQPSSDFPDPAPHIVSPADGELEPVGGDLQQIGDEWFNFFYYPPTSGSRLEVTHDGTDLGAASFKGAPEARPCDLTAGPPFEVIACDAVTTVRWTTNLPWRAARIDLLDVEVLDRHTRRPLGFYHFDSEDVGRHLVVTFGFKTPPKGRALVRLRYAYVDFPGREHPIEKSFPSFRPLRLALREQRT